MYPEILQYLYREYPDYFIETDDVINSSMKNIGELLAEWEDIFFRYDGYEFSWESQEEKYFFDKLIDNLVVIIESTAIDDRDIRKQILVTQAKQTKSRYEKMLENRKMLEKRGGGTKHLDDFPKKKVYYASLINAVRDFCSITGRKASTLEVDNLIEKVGGQISDINQANK